MLKKLAPNENEHKVFECLFSISLTFLMLSIGFFLYHMLAPHLNNKPVFQIILMMIYIPFQISMILFSTYFYEKFYCLKIKLFS